MSHHLNKKTFVLAIITGVLIIGTSAFRPTSMPEAHGDPSDLKVLSKDISDVELMQVMESFKVALNYGCQDCHARSATDSTKLDFASYGNDNKKAALSMMKMVQEINGSHFGVKGDFTANYLQSKYKVTCNTCHNGHEKPSHRISIPVNLKE